MLRWSGHLSFFQQGAAVSTLVLTVGAIWEYWTTLKHIPRLALKVCLLRSSAFDRCVLRKLLLHALPPVMVVAGIAGELMFETSDFIEENHKAAESYANVQTLRIRADKAEEKNAEQRLRADKLEAANLALEKELQPRALTSEQRTAIRSMGDRFSLLVPQVPGMSIRIISYRSDFEGLEFGKSIVDAMVENPPRPPQRGNIFRHGSLMFNVVPGELEVAQGSFSTFTMQGIRILAWRPEAVRFRDELKAILELEKRFSVAITAPELEKQFIVNISDSDPHFSQVVLILIGFKPFAAALVKSAR